MWPMWWPSVLCPVYNLSVCMSCLQSDQCADHLSVCPVYNLTRVLTICLCVLSTISDKCADHPVYNLTRVLTICLCPVCKLTSVLTICVFCVQSDQCVCVLMVLLPMYWMSVSSNNLTTVHLAVIWPLCCLCAGTTARCAGHWQCLPGDGHGGGGGSRLERGVHLREEVHQGAGGK